MSNRKEETACGRFTVQSISLFYGVVSGFDCDF